MLPMLGFLGVIEELTGFFRQMFSLHQYRRFKQYLSGLLPGRRLTVRSIASRLVEPADQSSLNRFISYDWDEEMVNGRGHELLQSIQTIGAECKQAFMNLIQCVYNKADKKPVDKILDMILK